MDMDMAKVAIDYCMACAITWGKKGVAQPFVSSSPNIFLIWQKGPSQRGKSHLCIARVLVEVFTPYLLLSAFISENNAALTCYISVYSSYIYICFFFFSLWIFLWCVCECLLIIHFICVCICKHVCMFGRVLQER